MKQWLQKSKDIKVHIAKMDDAQIQIVVTNLNSTNSAQDVCRIMYKAVKEIAEEYKVRIFHERIFGSNPYYELAKQVRQEILGLADDDFNFSYIDGSPVWGDGIGGIQIHGILDGCGTLKDIEAGGMKRARIWETKDADYFLLHTAHGCFASGYYEQTYGMFQEMVYVLEENGFSLKQVIRTWIYLDKILKQYDDFNRARTKIFLEQHMWEESEEDGQAENIYMPASTGIGCGNPYGYSVVSDVLAVRVKNKEKIFIKNETGEEQKSAFRYGSAFSRAMAVEDEHARYVYLSGTASIDDEGATVFKDDIKGQLEKTGSVIQALLKSYDMDMSDLCEGTVFLKKAEFEKEYLAYLEKMHLEIPVNVTVTDVCRDDLLFEMDAMFGKKID